MIVIEFGNIAVNLEIKSSMFGIVEYPSNTSEYGVLGTEIGEDNPGKLGAGPGEGKLKLFELGSHVIST